MFIRLLEGWILQSHKIASLIKEIFNWLSRRFDAF